jgi:hypothetical protein
MEKILELPVRTNNLSLITVKFPVKNKWGTGLKFAVRDEAKKLSIYKMPIQTYPIPIAGKADNGKEIPINILGKWLFGTPGYMSNMVVESFEEDVTFRLPDVPEVHDLINQAVKNLIKE